MLASYRPGASRLNLAGGVVRLREVLPAAVIRPFRRAAGAALLGGGAQELRYAVDGPEGPRQFETRLAATGEGMVQVVVRDVTRRERAWHACEDAWRARLEDGAAGRRALEAALGEERLALLHLSRVATLGNLSGAFAHELNQPLMSILMNAQAAQMGLENGRLGMPALGEMLRDIVAADLRAGEVIRRLRRLFSDEPPVWREMALAQLARDAIGIVRNDLTRHGVTATLQVCGMSPRVRVDEVQMQQVLINLLMNACEAMRARAGRGGHIVVRLDAPVDGQARLHVLDDGPGIPAALLARMFDPFCGDKAQGMGLGLSICRSIVVSHHGTLSARNRPEGGACLSVHLPIERTEPA